MSLMKHAPAALAALVLAVSPAMAQGTPTQPFVFDNGQLVLETLGQRLAMPLPSWVEDASDLATLAEQVSARFVEERTQAHLEIYRRGEGEAFWSTLYGARVSNQADMSLADFRALVINVYAQSCDPETVALFQLEPDSEDKLPPLGYVCGAYLDSFTDFAGQGEVMVVGFYKSEKGVGMVYQEWRGDAFDATNPASWPVPGNVVEEHMARLASEVTLSVAD